VLAATSLGAQLGWPSIAAYQFTVPRNTSYTATLNGPATGADFDLYLQVRAASFSRLGSSFLGSIYAINSEKETSVLKSPDLRRPSWSPLHYQFVC
jgi:hypothetical protein